MADLENEVEVPRFFLCPISLEIMKDPITLSTGITYDRDNIENWLFSRKNNVCPVTKQVVADIEPTPNHTLRRLIQSWCTLNASSGVERFPTPRPPISKTEIIKLLKDLNSPNHQMKSLTRLKSIVLESEKNKRLMESVDAADYLSTIISTVNSEITSSSRDEALYILYHIKLSPTGLKTLGKTEGFVDALTRIMQRASSYEARAYAVMLLKSMFEVAEPMQVTSLNVNFFMQLVNILVDQISVKATKATLKLLISVCPWGRNRTKAVEAGVVRVLIDALLDCSEKRVTELISMVLVQVCQAADGRVELLKHGGGLAVVSGMVFGVSPVASERAVRILYSVAMFSGSGRVLQEMIELGVVEKLVLVLQVDCGRKMKEKAREILKIHSRVWKKSHCVNYDLI
ncbi:putative U box domain, armadillo-like helical, Zinc finger, RING/FYVE/PHD-type [Helianthus annuus]|nr:putative U box domain, armadillo-like helical, Zinc finger, RING/FYVE/PHD-type [Helianthus annuus]